MTAPEARISPEGDRLAWRFGNGAWTAAAYGAASPRWISDDTVADWTPLVPTPTPAPDRVTCPWCGRPDRKLTATGRIRQHVAAPGAEPWPPPCEGTGRKPSEFGKAAQS